MTPRAADRLHCPAARADPIFAAVLRTITPVLLLVTVAAACEGGSGPAGPSTTQLLVVGFVRNDLSPVQPLEGGIAFFYDRASERLLTAEARIEGPRMWGLVDSFSPGVVPGPIYHRAPQIRPGERWRLVAVVFTPEGEVSIRSAEELVPQPFEVRAPLRHPLGQPLRVEWDDPPDAERVVVNAGSGFEAEIEPGETSFLVPASAFDGLVPGAEIEIEVTAFNNFYVSVASGIGSLRDAEETARRFLASDNVEGADGTFGAATSAGVVVTLE